MEDKILDKVQKLLDKAWSTTFEAEKASLLAKAEALMLKHSLDSIMLQDPSRPNTARAPRGQTPEIRTMAVFQSEGYWSIDPEIRNAMFGLLSAVADHLGCRTTYQGTHYHEMKIVGFPADLEMVEMMYLGLKLDFTTRMDPKIVSSLSWQLNLLALKQAGRKWEDIHLMLQDHPGYPHKGSWQRKFGVQFTGIYKKWRDENPDEPANTGSPKMWRTDFCLGYVQGIRTRMYEMRRAAMEGSDNLPALLKDKKQVVNDFFACEFPPVEVVLDANAKPIKWTKPKSRAVSVAALAAGNAAAQHADINHRNSRVSGGVRGEI